VFYLQNQMKYNNKQNRDIMKNNQKQIIDLIENANSEINIAVSWFTDTAILNSLINKVPQLDVKILMSADEVNIIRYELFQKLIRLGAKVKKLGSNSALDGNFMHSKFVIVDQSIAYGGSYNFTATATSNYETFKKWDRSELHSTTEEFDNWFRKGVDFFDGITDAEVIVKRLQDKFVEEKRRRSSMIERMRGIEFSEEEFIESWEQQNRPSILSQPKTQKTVVKENKLREKVRALSTGTQKVMNNGVVAAATVSTGHAVKKHSFYGGKDLVLNSKKKKNHFALLAYQKYNLDKNYDFFKTRIENDTLVAVGEVQPSPETDKYKIRLEYTPGHTPRVFVESPQIENSKDIHLYREGFLCLYEPSETKFKDSFKLSEYTIPWTIEWIMYYELWKLSGKWEGKEIKH
jgi:hypothetical protein